MASTVIVGSGVIGIATAYYLANHQPGSTIHVVDSSPELFASASGYAGGFLARDWFPPELESLGALSFREHEKLAERHGGREKWAYAKSVTVNYEPTRHKKVQDGEDWLWEDTSRAGLVDRRSEVGDGHVPPWLRRVEGDTVSVVDDGQGTAVLDPLRLCRFLLERCRSMGVRIYHPAVVLSVGADNRDELSHVRIGYTDCSSVTEIPATRVLVCAGCWTPQVLESMFPGSGIRLPVFSLAGHSLVVRNPGEAGDVHHSLYCSLDTFSPEVYGRPNGDIWLGGVNSATTPLPLVATGAKPLSAPLEELKATARRLIRSEGELEVVRTGLCFRPVTERGTPYIARIMDEDLRQGYRTRKGCEGGVFVATGHGPWGISLSLGTGRVVAEMMQGREVSADISALGYSP